MKGFLEEYGTIIVVVAVILLMLLFGKTGYAKSIQNAILGSANHIVETGENITKKEAKVGDTLDIEGTKYVVLEQKENNQALVMTANSIGEREFHAVSYNDVRPEDGQSVNTYEDSEIDNYLENDWYNSLSSKMKTAIQTTNIKQSSYGKDSMGLSYLKRETGYNGQVYNTINRHVFLPSVSEIGKTVDLKNPDKVKVFLNGEYIWTRDSSQDSPFNVILLLANHGELYDNHVRCTRDIRPTFVIDLSKVDYTEAGHVDYK